MYIPNVFWHDSVSRNSGEMTEEVGYPTLHFVTSQRALILYRRLFKVVDGTASRCFVLLWESQLAFVLQIPKEDSVRCFVTYAKLQLECRKKNKGLEIGTTSSLITICSLFLRCVLWEEF